MDALGVEFQMKFEKCAKKLKKFEIAEKERKEREANFNAWVGKYQKKKPRADGADAVLRDILSNKQPLGEAVAAADAAAAAAAANKKGESKNGGRRKTKKRRRKRKTKRKKRKTKKRRRKRKRKTKKKRRR